MLLSEQQCALSTVNLAEVLDRLIRVQGVPADAVHGALSALAQLVRLQPFTVEQAVRAGAVRADHYQRRLSRVSMSDCAALALAEELQAELATADRVQAAVARQLGISVVAVANSAGDRPLP